MVAVALYPFGQVCWPLLQPWPASSRVLVEPFVVKLVENKYAVLVAEVEERRAVWVVRCADMVEAEVAQHLYSLLHSPWISGCTECAKSMMVGNALEQYLLAVDLESEVGTNLDGPDAEACGCAVGLVAVVVENGDSGGIQMRCLAAPQFWLGDVYSLPFQLVGAHLAVEVHVGCLVVDDVSLLVGNGCAQLNLVAFGIVGNLYLQVNEMVVACGYE